MIVVLLVEDANRFYEGTKFTINRDGNIKIGKHDYFFRMSI